MENLKLELRGKIFKNCGGYRSKPGWNLVGAVLISGIEDSEKKIYVVNMNSLDVNRSISPFICSFLFLANILPLILFKVSDR